MSVSAGAAHSLALSSTGEVYGWGLNNYGQLGLGFTKENFEPGMGESLSQVYEPVKITALEGIPV